VLLQPAQALADLARANRAYSVDRLEVALRGADDALEPAELAHDALDHVLRESWDVCEDPESTRRDGMVEWVGRCGVAQHRELYHSFNDMLKSVQAL
jgi:hypothetical protein